MMLIDTSVLVAYFCPEPLHAKVRRALQAASPRLITPLIRLEMASALGIKIRTGELEADSARRVLTELQRQLDQGIFTLQEVTLGDYRQAYDWLAGFTTALRTADALHLACAAGCQATLLTADQGLARWSKHLKVPCKLLH